MHTVKGNNISHSTHRMHYYVNNIRFNLNLQNKSFNLFMGVVQSSLYIDCFRKYWEGNFWSKLRCCNKLLE